jgi:hypothetical protein
MLSNVLLALAGVLLVTIAGTQVLRVLDARAAESTWLGLIERAPAPSGAYDPELVAGLPEPARRYFNFVITPGARLAHVVELDMAGELSLGSKDAPNYQAMRAQQVLAVPDGFVWRVRAGNGLTRFDGSDGFAGERSWTRFWFWNLVPVARIGDNPDHLRSAFGRAVAEAAFWSPAALLPRANVVWSEVDADTARATVSHRGMTQTVDIRVDTEGRPLWVVMPRWSDANPEREFRLQPFGGHLDDFRDVAGYRLAFHVDGGNHFGTDDYFPFYRARVRAISFPADAPPFTTCIRLP